MASKLCSLSRSSARMCEDEVSDMEVYERKSKIPKMPRVSYKLEGRGRSCKIRKSSSRCQNFTVSMIPRPEWKKYCKKTFASDISKTKLKRKSEETKQKQEERKEIEEEEEEEGDKEQEKNSGDEEADERAASECCSLESKINEDLANFKNNVLKIPEFWTDAGQTVTNVLKNAVNIVSKQYPSADVDSFEQEIQNILKATDVVKNKIVTKTENIINDVNKIYAKDDELEEEPADEEIEATKVDELRSEYNAKKKSADMKEISELEKALKNKKESSRSSKKGHQEQEKKLEDAGGSTKQQRITRKKSKLRLDYSGDTRTKGCEKNSIQSCGDVIRSDKRVSTPQTPNSGTRGSIRSVQDKSCQTSLNWSTEMRQSEILANLNNQILELHQLCQDHISKFKTFNLQIKLRGICNKAQNTSVSKEIQLLNEEKFKLAEKNSKLHFYNRDLESAIKQKEQDLHQKDKLISQQKKLLSVRDELIEMLKNKCKMEEVGRV